jgi:hypothetical protein
MPLIVQTFKIEDSEGVDTINVPIRFAVGTLSLTDIDGFAQDFSVLLDNVIDGKILAATSTISHSLAGGITGKAVPANIEVQVGASLSFANNVGVRDTLYVPTFKKAFMSNGVVNAVDTDVAAFIAAILDGITPVATLIQARDRNEILYDSYVRGFETTRKKRVG